MDLAVAVGDCEGGRGGDGVRLVAHGDDSWLRAVSSGRLSATGRSRASRCYNLREVLVVGGACGLGLFAVALSGLGWLGGLGAGLWGLLVVVVGDAELRDVLVMCLWCVWQRRGRRARPATECAFLNTC